MTEISTSPPSTPWGTRLYAELRRLARRQMAEESGARTLQPTALLHEAWLRLGAAGEDAAPDLGAFRARAAATMRRVRIDEARRRRADRRDAARTVAWSDAVESGIVPARDDYVVALDAALDRLAACDPELARLVELKFFGGCEVDEIAAALEVSRRTVKRRWQLAKGWLHREVRRELGDGS